MQELPAFREQVRRAHAQLIVQVVAACQNVDRRPALRDSLRVATANGWEELVARLERIVAGERDATLLLGLDDEDYIVVESVLQGLQDPHSLPSPDAQADPSFAAPGIAGIVVAAQRGDTQALQWLGQMASQMQRAGGEMAKLGACLGPLSQGKTDVERLGKGLGASTRSLLHQIVEEMHKLQAQ
ncbi:hypothetical protein [Acidithiobacillus sp. AMEEHan]|uniref:hypothetical protein n=1 Tax=Acidithiobacillus sp. AMEEHan TaxID=2994951 RepID=UPI0027E48155|nr:hypothetical protein [Acidithiobacillus sp. AMEEHan]